MKEGERGEKRMGETTPFLNILETVGVLATLIFVLTGILGMGFSLTVSQKKLPRNRQGEGEMRKSS
ncbi:hypothetical protein EO98_01100 [Methanosarcina sp. 2.H.T.1A.6]|nr:hypothetical protein EO94_19565 [Methanosarcina sp. 2.H.T.1A.3]KKG24999.1 hypothetical protein EO97_10670 [Methanosarcina sp. 2.H.T.1A.15]KKG25110.1 hypothetical protein EO98_01100 [Methanosarcina sp. 2.H.T.1A.6]KKG27013.1 hypothetical protein EO96_11350 [Methanosarcina sp. 2.H.T.1A.8]